MVCGNGAGMVGEVGRGSATMGSKAERSDGGRYPRKTGIQIIGDVPWGTHFCQFYQTKEDLVDTLVPYFAAGLESNEFCMWVTAEPLGVDEAKQALRRLVPDLDSRISARQIEIIPHTDWYLKDGGFDQDRVLQGWVEKLNDALARGYDGLRLTGNTFWLEKEDWRDFTDYEEAVNNVIGGYRMLAICTYSVDKCGAGEVADVVANHEFAIMKRGGDWTVIESSTVKQAKQAIQSTLGEMEQLNVELASANTELAAMNEELRATNEEFRVAEEELHRLNRTLKAHSKSDQAMMRARDESEYLREVCKIIVEDCGHAMVWIGYAEDDEEKTVRPVACAGFEQGYLDSLRITWADTERGRGPTGTAIRTGKPSMCRNMLTDPKFRPWREQALKRGYASSIVVPLMADGKAFGAVSLYSPDPDPWTEDEIALLSDLADDLAYGITAIRLRGAHARSEETLRESEERYRTLFTSMSEGFALHEIICDELGQPVDYRFLEINEAFELQTGLKRDEIAGKTVLDVLPGTEDYWIRTYGNVALTGAPVRFENYSSALDRYYEVYAFSPSKGRFAVLFTDVTDRKLAEKEISRAQAEAERRAAELESFISSMSEGVIVRDADGCLVLANQAAVEILGTTPSGSVEDRVRQFHSCHVDGTPLRPEEVASYRAMHGETVRDERYRLTASEGREKVILVSSSPVQTPDGRILGCTSVVRDVTDQAELDRRRDEVYEREHHVAEVLQKALIPDSCYEIAGCEIAVRYEAALKEAQVGGDFYDIFDLSDRKLGLLIGDVAGKGLAAAIQVAAARHSVRSYAYIDPRPGRVMTLVNNALSRDPEERINMLTAFFAIIDLEIGVMTYANGGHEIPLLRHFDGTVEELQVDGRAIGVAEGYDYQDRSVIMKPGDLVAIVTDGIIEARTREKGLFGMQGMRSVLSRKTLRSADELADGLLSAAKEHADGALLDDAAIMIFGLKKEKKAR